MTFDGKKKTMRNKLSIKRNLILLIKTLRNTKQSHQHQHRLKPKAIDVMSMGEKKQQKSVAMGDGEKQK